MEMHTSTQVAPVAGPSPSLLRCLAVLTVATVALLGLAGLCAAAAAAPWAALLQETGLTVPGSPLTPGTRAAESDQAITLLAASAGVLAFVRLWFIVVATCVEVMCNGARSAGRPAGLTRRLALAACGVAVGLGAVVAPAQAADRSGLDGLPHPDRPTSSEVSTPPDAPTVEPTVAPTVTPSAAATAAPTATSDIASPAAPQPVQQAPSGAPGAPGAMEPAATPSERAAAAHADEDQRPAGGRVTVAPGDSLWALAERHLLESASGPGRGSPAPRPTASEVASLSAQLHARNRDVVGADPDLILPGQRLELPAATAPTHDRTDEESR